MKTVLNVKTDKDVKEKAQRLARHLGVPLSTVVNAYLKEFVHVGGINIHREPRLKDSVRKALSAQIASASRKNISPSFDNVEDALAWLHKK
jgi:addiction module RelB/DinJ family antitoxin